MNVLVLNAGSASLRFEVITVERGITIETARCFKLRSLTNDD